MKKNPFVLNEFLEDESLKNDKVKGQCPYGERTCPALIELENLKKRCKVLERLVSTDPLTGLYNFRHFIEALEQEMERSRRTGQPTSLIMIDLDFFKKINDKYGHQAGNKALKYASNLWKKNTRKIDVACRYGGEEFAIILPATSITRAIQIAERLRKKLERSLIPVNGKHIKLTASFGVDTYFPNERLKPDSFIKRTDQFLLEAKRTGRNKVCFNKELIKVKAGVTKEEKIALNNLIKGQKDPK